MFTRKPYPTDLTDAQWEQIVSLLPSERPKGTAGRPRDYTYREIVNAILYLLRTGCQWRNLPHDLPPYTLVSHSYHTWRKNETLDHIHDTCAVISGKKTDAKPNPGWSLSIASR